MILDFSVTNFLSIKETVMISFEAGITDKEKSDHVVVMDDGRRILKLACLYGANASGKTNILVALDFFLHYMLYGFKEMKPSQSIDTEPFLFTADSEHSVSRFNIQFYCKPSTEPQEKRFRYSLAVTKERVVEEELYWFPKTQRKLLFSRTGNEVKWGTGMVGGKQIVTMLSANVPLFPLAARLTSSPVKDAYGFLDSYHKYDNLEHCLEEIDEQKEVLSPVVMRLLSAMVDDHITGFEIQKKDAETYDATVIHDFDGSRYALPLRWESNGTKRFVALSLPLYRATKLPSFLMFDELELSLHEELLEYLLLSFLNQTKQSQLFFTTHDQDLMDSSILRDDEIWFAQKDEHGASSFSSVSDYPGIRKGVSRKKLYQAGKFGAKPVLHPFDLSNLL